MKRSYKVLGALVVAATLYPLWSTSLGYAKCDHHPQPSYGYRDVLTQIQPLEHLSQGGYEGPRTVAQVLAQSNFGIGTFTGLDGEMVALNGVVYQAPANGLLRVATPQEHIPFATLTRFHAEMSTQSTAALDTYVALQALLSTEFSDPNAILAIQLHGTFSYLKLRAPQKQTPPYPTLTEALKTQAIFEHTNIQGTFVGFRFPAYFGTVNAPGYHFHFISDDRKHGGHVLEVQTASFTASAETVEDYRLDVSTTN